MKRLSILVLLATANVAAAAPVVLKGAKVGASGFATIRVVPPSPTADVKSQRPSYNGPVEYYAQEEGLTIAEASKRLSEQWTIQPIFERLEERLRKLEPDNYVSARITHQPDWSYTLYFKRDPEGTLRKYHVNPRFKAAKADYTVAELQTITAEWGRRFAKARLGGVMMFPFENRVEMTVPVTEPEFRAIAKRENWGEVPAPIRLSFARELAVPRVDPRVAPYLRGFASESLATTTQMEMGARGRVVLDDGCLRLAVKGRTKGPLVVFHQETGIGLDAQGYLAAIDRRSGRAVGRIGEEWSWAARNPGTEFDGLDALKAACGAGPIENVGNPESDARFKARYPGAR